MRVQQPMARLAQAELLGAEPACGGQLVPEAGMDAPEVAPEGATECSASLSRRLNTGPRNSGR